MGQPWWIRKSNLRQLKKYRGGAFCDGTLYPFHAWEEKLNSVRDIEGKMMWNPLSDQFVIAVKVSWQWEPICRMKAGKPAGKILGSFISGFVIHTSDKYELTETPEFMNTLPKPAEDPDFEHNPYCDDHVDDYDDYDNYDDGYY